MPGIVQLKITLRDVKPPVWRRVQMSEDASLSDLHDVIQAAMGWDNAHLHMFEVGDQRYTDDPVLREEGTWDGRVQDGARCTLKKIMKKGCKSVSYTYDFGDDWRHKIDIEKRLDAEPGVEYPRVVKGKGACPPEDIGGAPGYDMFRTIVADPAHPQHDEMVEWFGYDADFDAQAFDLAATDLRLEPLRAGVRKDASGRATKTPESGAMTERPNMTADADDGDGFIAAALASLRDGAAGGVAQQQAIRALMAHPSAAGGLVRRLLTSGDPDPAVLRLIEMVLYEARLDMEGNGRHGRPCLDRIEAAIGAVVKVEDGLSISGVLGLVRAYVQADLSPPDGLSALAVSEADDVDPDDRVAMEQAMQEAVGNVLAEVESPEALRDVFRELLAGFPDEARGELAAMIAGRSEDSIPKLCLYWLLDPLADVRLAAAVALRDRMARTPLDRSMMGLLIAARRWMPADAARDAVDQTISAGRGGLVAVDADMRPRSVSEGAPVIEELATSIPDGAGAQQFGILVRRGQGLALAMVLTKAGFGVKDAFVIEGDPEETRAMFDALRAEANASVDLATLTVMIGAALGEGQALGHPPAPGLLDVLDLLALDPIDPLSAAPEDWAARADPDGVVAKASAQKRGRLVNESEDWRVTQPLAAGWFETDADMRSRIDESRTETEARRAVLSCVERRRAFWAIQSFKGAMILAADNQPRLAQSFTAVGLALMDGRPLTKIPIMESIVDATLDFHEADGLGEGLGLDGPDPDDLHLDGIGFEGADLDAPEPDRPRESTLADLMDILGSGALAPPDLAAIDRLQDFLDGPNSPDSIMSLSELDGYLFSVVIPEPPPPMQAWLPVIWDGDQLSDDNPMETADALSTILRRFSQIRTGLESKDPALGVIVWSDTDGKRLVSDWCRGFLEGMTLFEQEWGPIIASAPEVTASIMLGVEGPDFDQPPGLSAKQLAEARASLPDQLLPIARTLWDLSRGSAAPARTGPKVGRNAPCPCGSGKKYKKCCMP
ncbi:UPF0149 family protein [Roseospira navarrensis]|uniref:UPF0149 family protein n=1 Tax=Roseospira navarrensis TaxID=140058 RepID=A0A7X1ZE37_9PROT|nr:UPF0149 family protein [Roseospira navarrensis]MQX36364.1 UPF0149 family protein [Roseospira navarrensis]